MPTWTIPGGNAVKAAGQLEEAFGESENSHEREAADI